MTDRKTALVTGAATGIGRAIAERLADDGFALAINDISVAGAEAAAEALRAAGTESVAVPADVSDRDQVFAMVARTVADLGRLDVLVSNAGIVQVDPILAITESDFDRLFDINVKGLLWCAQAAAEQMIAQGNGGRIINAGSAASHTSHPVLGTYGASKFCVRALTQVMAREFAAHGITVNAYCPGIVDTGMWDIIDSRASEVLGIPPGDMFQQALEGIALGRVQTPEDVARLVSFLASDDADYITGQCILTDGGMVMI
ncbi:acetoin reductase [Seongchinamella sediminis]|uniref:Diacetyl reductase [(S)-acetoin forming] n=1 Tax=Seongchinamella sediminis TaxID=2283635 RepID=A0A3L7E278_9GAMM|nr:acetoin reductase [Seongchinamella sediminis]RLQ22381.1 acetoin reductase [Seongchinamella sediminis]